MLLLIGGFRMFPLQRVFLCLCVMTVALAGPQPYHTQEILTLATDDGPPHMIRATDGGLDIDITRAVLARAGFSLQVQYTALARAKRNVQNRMADVVVPTFFEEDEAGYYVSAPVVDYRPTFFTREADGHNFQSYDDVSGLRVATFQGAEGYFGERFAEMAKRNTYVELHDMSSLPRLLARGRADVVVLDYFIFQYHQQQSDAQGGAISFTAHSFMPTIPAYAGFHDPELRDRFNAALAELIAEGSRQKIVARYMNPGSVVAAAQ